MPAEPKWNLGITNKAVRMQKFVAPKVLIVDDDEDLLAALGEALESMQCEVKTARNGREALALLNGEKFTAVISDIRMPTMDGLSLLAAISNMGLKTPVIMMSGYSDYTDKQIDERNGVVLLEKPFSTEKVRELVERFLYLYVEAA